MTICIYIWFLPEWRRIQPITFFEYFLPRTYAHSWPFLVSFQSPAEHFCLDVGRVDARIPIHIIVLQHSVVPIHKWNQMPCDTFWPHWAANCHAWRLLIGKVVATAQASTKTIESSETVLSQLAAGCHFSAANCTGWIPVFNSRHFAPQNDSRLVRSCLSV